MGTVIYNKKMTKETLFFNANIYSKYRAELMGVATLFIILCHMPAQSVAMPSIMARIIGSAGFGCDIFLFLSGMGMWYSMESVRKGDINIFKWYYKRYIRIIIPYLLIVIPICFIHKNDFITTIIRATGFDYFVFKYALWFVSCILVLYLITPIIDKLLTSSIKWVYCFILIVPCLLFFYINLGDGIINNWQFVISRFPSYFIGYTLGYNIKNHRMISITNMIVLPLILYCILYFFNHKMGCNFTLFWLQGIPIMTITTLLLSKINNSKINSTLSFLGKLSLESYATNVLVLPLMKSWSWSINGFSINWGNWTFYIVGTILCLLISWIVNQFSKIILNRIIH